MKQDGRLGGRSALIIGGSRGIGFGIAEAFAREGADLMLAATDENKLEKAREAITKYGTRVVSSAMDVSERDDCFAVAKQAIAEFGRLDIMVNAAGLYIPRAFVDYTLEEFDRIQKVNVYGTFNMMQAVLPHMLERKYGKIINIASTAGKWASRNQSAYNVSKHGVVGMTRCVALETAACGITVNAICPGFVETDMLSDFVRDHAAVTHTPTDVIRAGILQRVPQGRFINIAECGHLAVYLASAESDSMTGQSLLLDGGMLFV